ncbi:MAG: substrate-binding domain-containing protein, partial [Candidatus Micrarchaeia archaeon]
TQIKMAEEAGKLLPELKVVAAAPEAYDPKKQAEYIDAAIAAKATAIIFTLSIPETLDPVLRKAHAAGIKLICINIEDYREPPEKLPYITYIGMDERISGTILAENLYAMFKEKLGRYPKRAVIGIHQPGLICLEMRADGILGVSKKYGVPNEKVDVTMDPTKVYETIKAYITTHPDTEAIFTLGPCGSHPVEKLIGDLGKAGVIFHGCIDLSPEVISAIEKGITQVAISQQPGAQAFYSVYVTYAYLKYGIIPPELIPTGPTVVTLKNLDVIKKQIETTGGA